MPDPTITPDTVRALIAGTTPGDWRSSWDDPDGDDNAPLIYSEAGPVCASMWYDGPRVACTEADAALMAASKRIAAAYLAVCEERDAAMRDAADAVEVLSAHLRDERASGAKVRADRDRLAAWLADIEGGDNPCDDAATLRRWAYEALTLGREAPNV